MNKNTIANEAISELNQLRLQNEIIANENYKNARKLSKKFTEADNSLRTIVVEYAKTQPNSSESKILKEKIDLCIIQL